MAVIISNGDTSLGTAAGFYEVEARNMSAMYAGSGLAVSTTRYIDVTFAHAGNCQGLVLCLYTTNMTSRELIVTLQENTGAWVDRASVTMSTADIAGTCTSGTNINRGSYFTACEFAVPYAVTVAAATWRFKIEHGAGVGTWVIATSNGVAPFYAAWCDNAATFADNDVVICKDVVEIDQTATFGAVLGTGDAVNGISCVICSNAADPSLDGVSRLVWQNPPAAAYTLTVGGSISVLAYSGIRIGSDHSTAVTISNASPAVVSCPSHGLVAGQLISFETTGVLPSPLDSTRGVYYYVSDDSDPDEFTVSATSGGVEVDTTTDGSGVHTLHWGRIPAGQKATLTFTAPVVGTAVGSIRDVINTTTSSYGYGGRSSLFCYGQIPRYAKTVLASDAVTGQAHLITTDNVDWVNGDQVVIGKQNVKGQGVTTVHTVSGVVGNDITLTTNLATNNRIAGGTVLRLGGHGIRIENTGTFSTHMPISPANFALSGIELYNGRFFIPTSTAYYMYLAAVNAAYRSQYLMQDCVFWVNTTSMYTCCRVIMPPDGMLVQRVFSFRTCPIETVYSYFTAAYASGRLTVQDCAVLSAYGYSFVGHSTNNNRVTMHDISFENCRASAPFIVMHGIECEYYNLDFWGGGTVTGIVRLGQLINPLRIENLRYNNCACGFEVGAFASRGCVDEDSAFGDETANTIDIIWTTGALPDYTFVNVDAPAGGMIFDETYLPDMVTGGKIGFVNFDEVATDDKVTFTLGKIQRTNAALADTTVHTAGGSAMRFEPLSSAERFDWSFDVPTGNILGKTMVIAIWCKINSATYYATPGAYGLPRLSVEYDGATEVQTTAAEHTDWQLLSVTFTPTTATGKVTVTLSGRTDATGSDAYFYWDDVSVLYPAGVALNLGGLDIWDNALPVTPPIATLASALDVWTASKLVDYGANSMGELAKDTGIAVATLPLDPASQSGVEGAITLSESVVTGAIAALNDLSSGDAETAAGAALTAYGAATGTDVSTATAPLALQTNLVDVQAALEVVRKVETGRWRIHDNQMLFYDTDGTTILFAYDLFNAMGVPSETEVYERKPV